MSYGTNFPCYCCTKKETCTDYKRLEEARDKIHQTKIEDGHQGSGTIILQCNKMQSAYA